jgi:hypothetical protein
MEIQMKSKTYTVGDMVNHLPTGFNVEISSFYVKDGELFFTSKHLQEDKQYSFKEIGDMVKPLFKTFDGIDIYEGDSVWSVDENFNGPLEEVFGKFQKSTKDHPVEPWYKGDKYFSSEEAAEKYILMNRRCLSVSDIFSCIDTTPPYLIDENQLMKLVKSRL